jgi:hypothetical protein
MEGVSHFLLRRKCHVAFVASSTAAFSIRLLLDLMLHCNLEPHPKDGFVEPQKP